MLFAYPTGAKGNVVSKGVNELIIPNYKQTWGNIRKIADAPERHALAHLQIPGVPLRLTFLQARLGHRLGSENGAYDFAGALPDTSYRRAA